MPWFGFGVWKLRGTLRRTERERQTLDVYMHLGEIVQPLLVWEINGYYTTIVCACVCTIRYPS